MHLYFSLTFWASVVLASSLTAEELDRYFDLSGIATDSQKETVRFSNTAQWDPKLYKLSQRTPKFLPKDWRARLAVGEPPKNSSRRTRVELEYLLNIQSKRTKDEVERIKSEITMKGFVFDGMRYPDFTNKDRMPVTHQFSQMIESELLVVAMQAKRYYDRPRPSVLEPELRPCIAIPGHPAYPSGHATQAYAWAYLLCEILPEDRHAALLTSAQLIGQDRELAGVH